MGEVFAGLRRDLGEFNQSTEREFLAVGETLQKLAGQTRDISGKAESMAALMQGQDFQRAVEGLQDILRRIESAERMTVQSREILCSMIDHLAQARRPLLGFGTLVRILNILGLYTRIENARLGDATADLSDVADDVRHLAAEIEEKSAGILEQAKALTGLLRDTVRRLDEQFKAQKGEVTALTQGTAASLKSLAECHRRGAAAAGTMSRHYGEVHRNISEVVTSLQFQDITRQQVEHVCEAFTEIGARWGSGEPDRETVRFAASGARVQAAQLRHTRDALIAAVSRILDSLRAIARQTKAISTATDDMVRATERQGNSVLDDVEARLKQVAGELARYDQSSRRLYETIHSTVSSIASMADFANQIENTGFAMTIVALNAQVKTSHIGAEGAALGVLAGKIQEITGDTPQWIGAVASHLRSLSEGAKGLAGDTGEGHGASVDALCAELATCTERISQTRRQIEESWLEIEAAAASLGSDLEKAAARIETHCQTGPAFESVLQRLDEAAAGLARPGDLGWSVEVLLQQEERYTMQAERAVHGAVTEKASASATEPAGTDQGTSGDEELGDNVELF